MINNIAVASVSDGHSLILKSPHMRTEPSDMQTDTMGVADSLWETSVSVPLFTSLSMSSFTLSLIQNSTGRDLNICIHCQTLHAIFALYSAVCLFLA